MLPIVLALIVAFFGIYSPNHVFVSMRNLSMLAIELSVTAVLALGMLLVILPGNIDLSAGSGVGLIGGVAAVLVIDLQLPAILAMGAGVVLAIILWTAMGWVIVKEKVPSFIITLGGLLVFKGIHWWVIRSNTIPVVKGGESNLLSLLTTFYLPPAWGIALAGLAVLGMWAFAWPSIVGARAAGRSEEGEAIFIRTLIIAQVLFLFVLVCNLYRGVPLPAIILGAVAVAIHVLTTHTPYGRYLYAIGGNEEAAIVSGLPVARVTITSFAIMGFLVAITGFLQTAYAGASTTTVGQLMELDAVAACVIGGVSLKGGRGTVTGVLLGSLIIAALLNGMTLLAYSPEVKYVVRGVILALAVWADVRLGRRS